MSNIYLCSDLHIGHKNINKFRCEDKGFFRGFASEQEHREWLYSNLSNLTKRDILICLGDIAFDREALLDFHENVHCIKWLVIGNHDLTLTKQTKDDYFKVFDRIEGFMKYKGYWFSHAPIHPNELRGRPNIYGHVHYATLGDKSNYFNVCPENLMRLSKKPYISLNEVKEILKLNREQERYNYERLK